MASSFQRSSQASIGMRYRVARVKLGSVVRVAAVLGLIVGLLPSLGIAAIVVLLVRRLAASLAGLATFQLTIPPQTLGPLTLQLPAIELNLIERLGLSTTAHTLGVLVTHPWVLFTGVTVGLMIGSMLVVVLSALVAVMAYNLLARAHGGIQVELSLPEEPAN